MAKVTETILEINLPALKHNYTYLRSKLNKGTKLMAIVKAFGYGSDSIVVAKQLQQLNVDYLAVAYVKEGVTLRDAGIKTPIIVLHPQTINFNTLIDRCLEPSLYSPKILLEFIKTASEKKQTNYPVHIKFNTGLNRLGFGENDVSFISSELKKTKVIKVASVFSHLAASEDFAEIDFTKKQISTFNKITKELLPLLNYKPLLHICNTSGVFNFPEAHFDMVRTGIGLYGFGNCAKENKNLIPIASLKSIISQIHKIEPGESVGYNRAYRARGYVKTATIPVGHADGLSRAYGNGKGWVTINGKKALIVGNVCMDMIMVDITNIDCNEGDEVLIFGENPTAEELAEKINSISYELITNVSQRVKRTFVRK